MGIYKCPGDSLCNSTNLRLLPPVLAVVLSNAVHIFRLMNVVLTQSHAAEKIGKCMILASFTSPFSELISIVKVE